MRFLGADGTVLPPFSLITLNNEGDDVQVWVISQQADFLSFSVIFLEKTKSAN